MKKFYSGSSVREADKKALEKLRVPGAVLMENAGRSAAEALLRRFPRARDFTFLCGPGNNGGDGFIAARHVALWGREASVISTIGLDKYKNDAGFAALSAKSCGVSVLCSKDMKDDDIASRIRSAGVVVDALLGTGSNGAPRGEVVRLIELCGDAAHLVSLDIPSGVDPDSGETYGTVLTAEATITFLAEKVGLAVSPGCLHAGEVEVCGIGVKPELVLGDHQLTGYGASDIPALRPRFPKDAHKGTRGALMVVGGSETFRGAPLFAGLGALRAGCGLVFLAVPDFMATEASSFLPEAILLPLPSKGGFIRYRTVEKVLAPWFDKCGAIVLGPGIGRNLESELVTNWIRAEWKKPLLMDADALHNIGNTGHNDDSHHRRDNVVITPHEGEAAFLLGSSAKKVAGNRLSSCADLSEKFGTALLKGPHTLICSGAERRVILDGGPELAVPGSGDVLSGVIGAFLATGMRCADAATLGALLHAGAAASCARREGILARELADNIGIGDD
ncbi:MAG: NAD(P)H-hydrate dehydratase [Synergistaceae bacterium]|jgi:NAD(P)H-hydrate epimerase|nr:NAD(P)H-hydrate dehydratase [Synergistaceae bacterium]